MIFQRKEEIHLNTEESFVKLKSSRGFGFFDLNPFSCKKIFSSLLCSKKIENEKAISSTPQITKITLCADDKILMVGTKAFFDIMSPTEVYEFGMKDVPPREIFEGTMINKIFTECKRRWEEKKCEDYDIGLIVAYLGTEKFFYNLYQNK